MERSEGFIVKFCRKIHLNLEKNRNKKKEK
jgi:hypothetical protein